MINSRHDINGLSVDTFDDQVILDDDVSGTVVTMSDEEAELLAKQLLHAVEKVRSNQARRRKVV